MTTQDSTPDQTKAILTDHPRVLCIAGPGSGKTATLIARIRHLINSGVPPERIAAITFTNAAAREIEARLNPQESKTMAAAREAFAGSTTPIPPPAVTRLGHCGTLHSLCLRLLREHGTGFGYGARLSIISPESALALLESKAKTLGYKEPLEKLVQLKAKGRPARGFRLSLAETAVASYFDELKENGIVDFDIILSEARDLLTVLAASPGAEPLFSHLFVDEVQDSSTIDWEIYKAFPASNKFFVGDPDQAIYSFRGGNVNGLMLVAEDPRTLVIKLEENFRSRTEICEAANRLIARNQNRVPKMIVPTQGEGGGVCSKHYANEGEEIGAVARMIIELHAEGVDANQIAIIARTNAIAIAFRKTLAATGHPVISRQASDLPIDWAFTRAFVELMVNPENDAMAFFFLSAMYHKMGAMQKEATAAAHAVRKSSASCGASINATTLHLQTNAWASDVIQCARNRGCSAESVMLLSEKLRELPYDANALDLALAAAGVRDNVKESGEGITVTTIHGAKGREWDVVFVVGFEDEVIPGRANKINDQTKRWDALEEERRLAFVAITRARNAVIITSAGSRVTPWGAIEPHTPSRFIEEIMVAADDFDDDLDS